MAIRDEPRARARSAAGSAVAARHYSIMESSARNIIICIGLLYIAHYDPTVNDYGRLICCMQNVHRVLVQSIFHRDKLTEHVRDKTSVLPNGIDAQFIRSRAQAVQAQGHALNDPHRFAYVR